ncbi:hypothetical protein PseBG33_1352 [Pseudomonas synxantha BG33R]|uniref:hypothetical protein n=1 Tax=Pseudomonas synxantha TaxID=47883 RepID=UPI00025FF1CA|nr:hypothetical protein [Pseudomonas synxantha]EIK69467.1 hypothetical protein PseBG33_1352 [Pseudomonas synxantha BG33R]
MSDYSELERVAEAANAVNGDVAVDIAISSECGPNQAEIDSVTAFFGAATPATILALIAENKTLNAQVETFQSDANSWQSGYDEGRRMGTKHMYAEVDRLKAELDCPFRLARHSKRLVEQLRAEVAGLKTGYEAYERVNAELKAECEALRKDADRFRRMRAMTLAQIEDTQDEFDAEFDRQLDAAMGNGEQS